MMLPTHFSTVIASFSLSFHNACLMRLMMMHQTCQRINCTRSTCFFYFVPQAPDAPAAMGSGGARANANAMRKQAGGGNR